MKYYARGNEILRAEIADTIREIGECFLAIDRITGFYASIMKADIIIHNIYMIIDSQEGAAHYYQTNMEYWTLHSIPVRNLMGIIQTALAAGLHLLITDLPTDSLTPEMAPPLHIEMNKFLEAMNKWNTYKQLIPETFQVNEHNLQSASIIVKLLPESGIVGPVKPLIKQSSGKA